MLNLLLKPYTEFLILITIFLALKFPFELFYGFQPSDKIFHFVFISFDILSPSFIVHIQDPFIFQISMGLFLLSIVSVGFSTCCHVFLYVCFSLLCAQCCVCFVYRNSLKPRMLLSFSTKKIIIFALSRYLQVLVIQFQRLKYLKQNLFTSSAPLLGSSPSSLKPHSREIRQPSLVGPRHLDTDSLQSFQKYCLTSQHHSHSLRSDQ